MMTQVFTGPPTIIYPLTDQVIRYNERITLYCNASGDGTVSYQWQEFSNGSWMGISNSINPEYTTDGLTESTQFRCVVSNEAGQDTSATTILVLSKGIVYDVNVLERCSNSLKLSVTIIAVIDSQIL